MSTSRRDALLARFRAGAHDRLAGLQSKLATPSAEVLADVRAVLHTLKGESRMLGLASVASLVHIVEDWLAEHDQLEGEVVVRLRAILELLHEQLDADPSADVEAALARGRALMAGELAAEPEPASTPTAASGPAVALSMVESATLDQLCGRMEQLRAALGAIFGKAGQRGERSVLLSELEPLRHELGELTELAWSLQLVPVEPAMRALADHARELAERLGKRVRVEVDAGGAELDRSLLERLHEPLLHLVRNAIDHGIEAAGERGSKPGEAHLRISARPSGRELELEVTDDGRGIALERVRTRAVEQGLLESGKRDAVGDDELLSLLFMAGFSTAAQVGELSGRGLGLDIVRRVVESLGGNVELRSEAGRGTTFLLRVPATISRERVVVVELGDALWGLPARRVGPILALAGAVTHATGTAAVLVDGRHVPLLSLAALLGYGERPVETLALCCARGKRRYALASPPLLGEFELFRLPIGPTLASIGPAAASAMMDDGRLVLLLEPAALLDTARRGQARFVERPARKRPRVLVVDDSVIVRELVAELLAGSQLEVETAEHGQAALERLAQAHFDLVVSDVEMPLLDGFGLLEQIRQRHADLPVIMVSTRGSQADRQRASSLGADAYVVKSEFTEQTLLDSVARFVEVVR